MRGRPNWWDWEFELSPHVERRMVDRNFTEVDLRGMLERADRIVAGVVEGRHVVSALHRGKVWEIVLEPDDDSRVVVIVTAYAKD